MKPADSPVPESDPRSQPGALAPRAAPGPAPVAVTRAVPAESQPQVRKLSLTALWRFKWTALLVTVVIAPLALGAVWLTLPPEYQGQALVHVRSRLQYLVEESDYDRLGVTQYDRYILSQVQIIRSTAIAERVHDRADVRNTGWYTESPPLLDRLLGRPTAPFDRLGDELEVDPVNKTELISIRMATRVPADAAVIVNAFVDEYMGYVNEQFTHEDRMLLDELQKEERSLTTDIAVSENVASDARRKLGTGASADQLINQQRVRFDELQGKLAQVELQMGIVERQLAQAQADAAAATSQPAGDDAALLALWQADPEWQRLHNELDQVGMELAELPAQFGSDHPLRVRLDKRRAFLRERLSEREQVLAERGPLPAPFPPWAEAVDVTQLPRSVEGLERQRDELTVHRDMLRETIDRFKQEYAGNFELAELLHEQNRNVERLGERLAQVHKRERELLEKGRVPPAIRTIARATPPTQPANGEKRVKMTLAALFGAVALGLGAAWLRFRFDPKVAELAEVEQTVQGPFLGYLPYVAERTPDPRAASAQEAEAMRGVRTALLSRLRPGGGHVLQISSADQGSGKSTVAVLLARSLAQLGHTVLLVDTDVRRPRLGPQFALDDHPGLLGLLRNGHAPVHGAVPIEQDTLAVLPAGHVHSESEPELLASGKFSGLLDEWRLAYDYTILDSPPLRGVADAAILARQVDGTVLVVRVGHCHRTSLAEALTIFGAAGGHLLGTVLVGGPGSRPYYGNGYDYQPIGPAAQSMDLAADVSPRK